MTAEYMMSHRSNGGTCASLWINHSQGNDNVTLCLNGYIMKISLTILLFEIYSFSFALVHMFAKLRAWDTNGLHLLAGNTA